MKEKKYRKLEVFNEKNKNTDFLYFNNEKILYQKFTGNTRGYDIIFVGGIMRSEEYTEYDNKYVDVEPIINENTRKDITKLLVDCNKSEKFKEVVRFYDEEVIYESK